MTSGCMGKPRRSEGMDESRIKKLAEKCYEILPAWDNKDDAIATIAAYLRTVAAEAREEGIDDTEELVTSAKEMLELIESTDFDCGGSYDDGPNNDDMNRWHGAVLDAAERLKEKGK